EVLGEGGEVDRAVDFHAQIMLSPGLVCQVDNPLSDGVRLFISACCHAFPPRERASRRIRSFPSATRAALAPHAPCTPPPGCALADARYRPRIGVSGRPSPGIGRNTSCW